MLPHLHSLDGRPWNVRLGYFRTSNFHQSTGLAAGRKGPHGVATGNVRAVVLADAAVSFLAAESHVDGNTRAGLLRLHNGFGCVEVGGQHASGLRVPVLDASPHLQSL